MENSFVFIFSLLLLCFSDTQLCFGQNELPKLEGIVKTIHVENEVIDCVDIYKQPAFNHPLLKDHKIQMMPPQDNRLQSNASEESIFYHIRNEIGECPEGTVPIKRYEETNQNLFIKMKGVTNHLPHEYAAVRVDEGVYYGTKFAATVWNPHVEPNELSLAQTWIEAGSEDTLNSIKVGWTVFPGRYKDNRTRLFTFWTNDGYQTFCYDLLCPGYIQLSRRIYPGAPLSPISQYGTQNFDVWITVYKAKGNWYLQVGDEVVGYWPANIFPLLKGSASRLQWGGEILNAMNGGHHTTTQMGSGHYANEKYSKAALIHNLQVNTKEDSPNFERPRTLYAVVTKEGCYSLLEAQYDRNLGDHFFYGGPGYSKICP